MELYYNMSAQKWKDLLNYLSARGCRLIDYPKTDKNGLFVDFKYALVEYDGMFFYMDANTHWEFAVCKYHKVSPYEKQQSAYPCIMNSAEELLEYIKTQTKCSPLRGTYKQRIFLNELYQMIDGETVLWHLKNSWAGNREKEILENLDYISTIQHTHDYRVLRFHSKFGNFFDYEVKSKRITG